MGGCSIARDGVCCGSVGDMGGPWSDYKSAGIAQELVAQGASQQAASLQEAATASGEVTSMTSKNAKNSESVAVVMATVDERVTEGNRKLDHMVCSNGRDHLIQRQERGGRGGTGRRGGNGLGSGDR